MRNRNLTRVQALSLRTRWTRTRVSSAFLENPLDPNPRFHSSGRNPLDPLEPFALLATPARTHARTRAHERPTTNDATCGPPAWLTGRLHEGGVRSVRSLLRRAPLLATPFAVPLQGGRPERSDLLFLKLLTTSRSNQPHCPPPHSHSGTRDRHLAESSEERAPRHSPPTPRRKRRCRSLR